MFFSSYLYSFVYFIHSVSSPLLNNTSYGYWFETHRNLFDFQGFEDNFADTFKP